MFFLLIIMGSTDPKAPAGFAPIAIGLGLTLIHLIGIPVTERARIPPAAPDRHCSRAAVHWQQLWLFWVAPIFGAVAGAAIYRGIGGEPKGA